MRVCNNSTPVPFLFHNSVHKVNQSVYKIKLFAKLHTASFRKTEIKKRVRESARIRREEMKKGGREGSPYGYAVRGVTGSREKAARIRPTS